MVGAARFETLDLNLVAFLRCHGFQIADIRQIESRTVFTFADSGKLRESILDFANDGQVGARSFANTLRDLKALIRAVGTTDRHHIDEVNGE